MRDEYIQNINIKYLNAIAENDFNKSSLTELSSSIRKLPRDITDAMVNSDLAPTRRSARASMPNIGTPVAQPVRIIYLSQR